MDKYLWFLALNLVTDVSKRFKTVVLVVAAVLALVPELVVHLEPMMLVDVIQQLALAVVTRLVNWFLALSLVTGC